MKLEMDRHGFLTWTTYGSWLPGDKRGFVSNVRKGAGGYERHNVPGTPFDADLPNFEKLARQRLKSPPIRLVSEHAEVLLDQFRETAEYRGWQLLAVGIMANHTHIVVGVPGDPDPADVLRDFKAYGSRTLSRRWKKSNGDKRWTESGSKRKLPDEQAVLAAVKYVMEQEYPLVIWTAAIPEQNLPGGRIV